MATKRKASVPPVPTFDCRNLFHGGRDRGGEEYAHEYDEYLAFFRMLGHSGISYNCANVPPEWAPFVVYLGHEVVSQMAVRGDSDENWIADTNWLEMYRASGADRRRVVEVVSTTRPELVHALYCSDTEWPCQLRYDGLGSNRDEFPVTCNGSFFRPEVLDYIGELRQWNKPEEKTKCVLVPCAASKPYPAPMHAAVLERIARLPDAKDWHVIVTTGVLGLVPEEKWAFAPRYDSGLPNLDRVIQTIAWYFARWKYERVVVYSDFYAYAIKAGFARIGIPKAYHSYSSMFDKPDVVPTYVFGSNFRDTYENGMLTEHLDRLERHMRGVPGVAS